MTAEGPSTLYRASETGRTAIVRALLEIGSDPDEPVTGPGWMPLMIASAEGHREIVLVLLQAGAKVDTLNARGRAALMFAAQYGYSDIVCDLLEQGADPNIVPSDRKRRTALVAAAYKGHEETVPILVENGADVTVKDKKGSHGVDERRIARSFRSGEHSASPITDRASPP
jgi:ankyrin repeat protein